MINERSRKLSISVKNGDLIIVMWFSIATSTKDMADGINGLFLQIIFPQRQKCHVGRTSKYMASIVAIVAE